MRIYLNNGIESELHNYALLNFFNAQKTMKVLIHRKLDHIKNNDHCD